MKGYSAASIFFFCHLAHLTWAGGPINFNNAVHIRRLNHDRDHPIDLYRSIDTEHLNKFFTARTIFRLSPGSKPLSTYQQRALRNEICASRAFEDMRIPHYGNYIGSIGIYLHDQAVVSIADNSLAGQPLDGVLRELSLKPSEKKLFFAKYYANAIARILWELDENKLIWNNFELSNLYLRPDGLLHALDLQTASKGEEGLEGQRNHFIVNVLRDMYDLLFPDPAEAFSAYTSLVTNARGSDHSVVTNAANARAHPWSMMDIKAVLANSLGDQIDPYLRSHKASEVAETWKWGVENFLLDKKPFITRSALISPEIARHNLDKISHQAEVPFHGFGIADNVRMLIIDPKTDQPYNDLSDMCKEWTG